MSEDENTYYVLGGPDSDEKCTIDYRPPRGPFRSYCHVFLTTGEKHRAQVNIYEVGELGRMIDRLEEIKEKMERDRGLVG
jgi:hypothetical protein